MIKNVKIRKDNKEKVILECKIMMLRIMIRNMLFLLLLGLKVRLKIIVKNLGLLLLMAGILIDLGLLRVSKESIIYGHNQILVYM